MTRVCVVLVGGLALVGWLGGGAAPAARAVCTVSTALPAPPGGRPHETLRVRVLHGLRGAEGSLAVSFAPEVATGRLVFRLWPNSPFYAGRGARLIVGAVTSGGRRLETGRPDPTTLIVHRALAAHERITVSMSWALRMPRVPGLQLYGGRSARFVSFFPTLAWNGHGWATDPPVPTDSFWPTSPIADFDARVTVPPGLRVLATGEDVGGGRWRARAVRDFAFAVGRFRTATATVSAPRPVRLTVGMETGNGDPAGPFLDSARSVLRFYGKRYGGYPWSTYTVAVMSDPTGLFGTAYPTIGFIGDGSLALVPHETAHQWFYSLVGNDQSHDPWLSEGLATWAQTGPEGSLPQMLGTAIPAAVRNRMGEPMRFWSKFDFDTIRSGLYVQSAQALASLGSAADVDCALRAFVVRNAYRTAVPRDLLASLQRFFPDAARKLRARGARF